MFISTIKTEDHKAVKSEIYITFKKVSEFFNFIKGRCRDSNSGQELHRLLC